MRFRRPAFDTLDLAIEIRRRKNARLPARTSGNPRKQWLSGAHVLVAAVGLEPTTCGL